MTPKQYYTYFLIDPRNDEIFYVGKGTGKRSGTHARLVRRGYVDNAAKCERIRQIHDAGLEVVECINSRHSDEGEAFAEERKLIATLPNLTNLSRGCETEAQKAAVRARLLLARMKSYEEWVMTAPINMLRWAEKWEGGARACYDSVREGFLEVANA